MGRAARDPHKPRELFIPKIKPPGDRCIAFAIVFAPTAGRCQKRGDPFRFAENNP